MTKPSEFNARLQQERRIQAQREQQAEDADPHRVASGILFAAGVGAAILTAAILLWTEVTQ